jgi:hypothetical protein
VGSISAGLIRTGCFLGSRTATPASARTPPRSRLRHLALTTPRQLRARHPVRAPHAHQVLRLHGQSLPAAFETAYELLLRFSQRSSFSRRVQVLPDLHRVDVAATATASNLDPAAPGKGPSVGSASRTDKRNFASLHLKILLSMIRNRLSFALPSEAKVWSCSSMRKFGLKDRRAKTLPSSSAPGWIRTSDRRIRSPVLCPLSYGGRGVQG